MAVNRAVILLLWVAVCFFGYAESQLFVLSNFEAFFPRIAGCVTPDVMDGPFVNVTECGSRSDGCNYDTGYCILAQILGYPLGNFMSIVGVPYSAQMPGVADGAINVSISYTNFTFTSPQGILQLWVLEETVSGIGVYKYANREYYLLPTPPNTVQTFTFLDLPAGQYLAAFWDWGGTRYGNGIPETSLPIIVGNVFPVRLSLYLDFVEEYRSNATGTGLRYPETLLNTTSKHYMGYRLKALGLSESTLNAYLHNARAQHNRAPAWIWRTDQGNVITVTVEKSTTCVPSYTYTTATNAQDPAQACDGFACSRIFKQATGTNCPDPSWTRQSILPMNSGGYGVVYDESDLGPGGEYEVRRNGIKTSLEFRLNYEGMDGTWPIHYWQRRQAYFRTTVVARKRIGAIQISAELLPPITGRNTPIYYARFNHVRRLSIKEDLLVVYYLPYSTGAYQQIPLSNALSINYGMNFGLLQFGMEAFGNYDTDRANSAMEIFFGGTGFMRLPQYVQRSNQDANNAFSCWAVGSATATFQYTNNQPYQKKCDSCPTQFTFADLQYDRGLASPIYSCSVFYSTSPTDDFYVPCTDFSLGSPLCTTCCQMYTSPGDRTYPCYLSNSPEDDPSNDEISINLISGVSGCMPDLMLTSTAPARFQQRSGSSPRIEEAGGTYSVYQRSVAGTGGLTAPSWSVFGTIKDCAALDDPVNNYYWDGFPTTVFPFNLQNNNPGFVQLVKRYTGSPASGIGFSAINAYINDILDSQPVFLKPIFPNSVGTPVARNSPIVTNNTGFLPATVWGLDNSWAQPIRAFPPSSFYTSYDTRFNTETDLKVFPAPRGSLYDYLTEFFGQIGYDMQYATSFFISQNKKFGSAAGPRNNTYINQMSMAYARFKLYPRINFHNFMNAVFPHDGLDATIDIEFRISCPNLDFSTVQLLDVRAPCAEGWYVTNQFNQQIIVSVPKGTLETDPAVLAAAGRPYGQVLGQVRSDAVFIVRIKYNDGDILRWNFNIRANPEWPADDAFCTYSTADTSANTPTYRYQFIPPPFTIQVPPQQYVFLPMIVNVASAQPACEYNPQEVRARAKRSQYYNFEVVNAENIRAVGDNGQRSESQLQYYYDWRIGPPGPGQTRVQGFAESTQLYTPPMTLTVYDHFFAFTTTQINLLPVNPLYPNPLLRPPRCVSETLANASCPINIQDSPDFSGINQFQFCSAAGINSVALTPRFIFIPPYSYLLNVGSCFFNFTTAYISPLIEDQLYGGIFEDCRTIPFLVDQNNAPSGSAWVSLKVRYGITIASFFDVPCWERFIVNVVVLSSFVLNPLPIEYIPGCTRIDNCCYRQRFVVTGTSPFTGQPVDLSNSSTPCFGQPFCAYEIVVSPPANELGGLCLGVTYTFTAQSPAALVANRVGPFNASFPFAWRCPTTLQITLPFGGFSPLSIFTTPGKCSQRGTIVRFEFTFTDVGCDGPITALNTDPLCRRDIYFALSNANNSNAYLNSGAPTISNPFRIDGTNSFSYNILGTFTYPNQFFPPGFPPIPNGFWVAYFWAQTAGTPPNQPGVTNPEDTVAAEFTASLANADGLTINRLEYTRPRCPGPSMNLTFIIYDLAFNGPYTIFWIAPSGAIISNTTITFDAYCPNAGLVPDSVALADCAPVIQTRGIPITARVQTGPLSIGETGLFTLAVYAQGSDCPAEYQEFIVSMETLRVQIACFNTTCPGGRDGNVNTEVTGGTRIPVINLTTVQGSDFDIFRPLYYYVWSTPQGLQVIPDLFRVPAGFYSVTVTDFNNCTAPVQSCSVASASTQMTLVPVSQTPPNCTGELGRANFTIAGGVAPYSLYKISNRSVVVTEDYTILSDSTVVPGENTTYVVIDSLGCVSPSVSFFLDGAPRFFLNLIVVAHPCDATSATGTIRADTPGGLGTILVWTNLLTGQVVSSTTNCLLGSQCLEVTNLPASTYRVVATSTLYGCTTEATVALTARPPPDIQITRQEDSNSAFLDTVAGSIFSSNGPPYTVSFFGVDFNVPIAQRPIFTQQPPSGNLVFWTLTNLPAQTTFQIRVTDAGKCVNTATSLGRQITIVDNLATPTPIPGQFSDQPTPIPSEKDRYDPDGDMIFVIFVFIVPFGTLAVVTMGYFIFQRRQVR